MLLQIILSLIGLLVAAYFLVPPILVYNRQRFSRDMRTTPFDPEAIPRSQEVARYFDESIAEMASIGFECVGVYSLYETAAGFASAVQVYRNPATLEAAIVNRAWSTTEDSAIDRVQFTSEYLCSEIQRIQTSNISEPKVYPRDRKALEFYLPQITKIADLYDCHKKLCERHAPLAMKALRLDDLFRGDVARYLWATTFVEECDRQIQTGYLQSTEQGWRPTLFGAFMLTWKGLWPFGAFRVARHFRQARKLERSLV